MSTENAEESGNPIERLNQEEVDTISLLIEEYGDQMGYPRQELLRSVNEKLPHSESGENGY